MRFPQPQPNTAPEALRKCAACVLVGLALVFPRLTLGDMGVVHVVDPGETLASIADRYYGAAKYESVLVAENGLTTEGGSAIVIGLRLRIPTVTYHRVEAGETWPVLAQRFYGDPRRAFVLLDANGASPSELPDEGASLVIPYPLRHVVSQKDSLHSIARTYYGRATQQTVQILKRFNFLRRTRLFRGQIVLVPLSDLELSEAARERVFAARARAEDGSALKRKQREIDDMLPQLHDHVVAGRYAEAVAMGGRLLGRPELTGNQHVMVQRELATAFVALGREDLAIEAFREALRRQAFLELDTARTSPKVLDAFHEAKTRHAKARAEAEAQAGDAAVEADAGTP